MVFRRKDLDEIQRLVRSETNEISGGAPVTGGTLKAAPIDGAMCHVPWRGREDTARWNSPKPDLTDPPPCPGWSRFVQWEKAVRRWDKHTDVAIYRRAERILKMFDWDLQEKFDHLTDSELEKPGYLEAIFAVMNVIINENGTGE